MVQGALTPGAATILQPVHKEASFPFPTKCLFRIVPLSIRALLNPIGETVKKAFGLIFLLLVGCATASEIPGPDGSANQLIRCPDVEMCYQKAADVCHGKYTIVNSTRQKDETELLVKCNH